MEKIVISEGTLTCLGKKNSKKPDRFPPLEKPVEITIKFFNDGIRKILCPHLSSGGGCEAGPGEPTSGTGGRDSNLTWHGTKYPICFHLTKWNLGETSWNPKLDDDET
ncbi:MAG: hypothetical protein V1908_03990 [Candidatus Peregrinibacteria bacterium]